MSKFFVFLFLYVFVAFAGNIDPEIIKTIESVMNKSINPCDDFWSYACGGWISSTKIPSDKSRLTRSFTLIEDRNQEILLEIVENVTHPKLYAYYNACMDTVAIDSLGKKPVLKELLFADIAPGDTRALMFTVAYLSIFGVETFFSLQSVIDAKNPKMNIAQFDQGGLGLPDESLYFSQDNHSVMIQKAYLKHITKIFQLVGDPDPIAEENANMAYTLEAMIANFTISSDQLTDPFTIYNKMTVNELKDLTPGLIWDEYFSLMNSEDIIINDITLTVPSFFSNLSSLLTNENNFALWRPYLRWQILLARAEYLSKEFREEHFDFFSRILNGQEEETPRWRQCISYTDKSLGELLGNFFAQIAFPGTSEKDATEMLSGIINAMSSDINSINWMDATTRAKALQKLSMVTHLIGSPENPRNYSDLYIGAQFYQNTISAEVYNTLFNYRSIGKMSDKMLWEMTAPTVNAYYDPSRNQMVFPAGILQQPFYNDSYPPNLNYGVIGMVMGHELTHGFDNQGRLYDGSGLLINWWDNNTNKAFNDKVQCFIDQYSKFQPIPGVFINGQLTQGENIADNGGIRNSFRAYTVTVGPDHLNDPSIIPYLTNAQLFFVAFGQTWCEIATDAYYRLQVVLDVHSPAKFRVLGPLMNFPSFAESFKCPQGSAMNPTNQCAVW